MSRCGAGQDDHRMKTFVARPRAIQAIAFALAIGTAPAVIGSPAFFIASTLRHAFWPRQSRSMSLRLCAFPIATRRASFLPVCRVVVRGGRFRRAGLAHRAGGALMLLLCLFDVAHRRLRCRDGIGFGDIS